MTFLFSFLKLPSSIINYLKSRTGSTYQQIIRLICTGFFNSKP